MSDFASVDQEPTATRYEMEASGYRYETTHITLLVVLN